MNAPQDAWAEPMAKRLIDRFRTQALTYIKIGAGAYNEVTGTISNTETAYAAAGAVTRSVKVENKSVRQSNEVEAWIDHATVPWPITSGDQMQYLTSVASYGSGGDGTSIGPVYLTTRDGKIIVTVDGRALVVQGSSNQFAGFTMYASKITARAE
jgi:hypothetical protein